MALPRKGEPHNPLAVAPAIIEPTTPRNRKDARDGGPAAA